MQTQKNLEGRGLDNEPHKNTKPGNGKVSKPAQRE